MRGLTPWCPFQVCRVIVRQLSCPENDQWDPIVPLQVEALRLRALPCGAFLNMAGTLRSLHVSNVRLQKAGLPNCWSAFSALREVTLFNVGLEGPLPPSWVGMRNLTALHLGDNPGLSGTLPSQWGALRRLRLLDLSLNFEAAARSGIQVGLLVCALAWQLGKPRSLPKVCAC